MYFHSLSFHKIEQERIINLRFIKNGLYVLIGNLTIQNKAFLIFYIRITKYGFEQGTNRLKE